MEKGFKKGGLGEVRELVATSETLLWVFFGKKGSREEGKKIGSLFKDTFVAFVAIFWKKGVQERRVRKLVATSGHFCGDFLEKRGQEKRVKKLVATSGHSCGDFRKKGVEESRVRKLVATSETLLWQLFGIKGFRGGG